MEQEVYSKIENEKLDKRFYTIKNIKIYDSPELRKVVREVPKGTLLPYERLVIRNKLHLARIKEGNKRYSYFIYKNFAEECKQCVVLEGGMDILDIDHAELDGIDIKIKKKEFTDKNHQLKKGEVFSQNGETVLLLRDNKEESNRILQVTIADNTRNYSLMHLRPYTKFYSYGNEFLKRGTTAVFLDGQRKTLFNKEGMFKEVNDAWTQMYYGIMVTLAVIILLVGIIGIAITTGYIVLISIIMIPVALGISAIVTLPIMWLINYIRKYF